MLSLTVDDSFVSGGYSLPASFQIDELNCEYERLLLSVTSERRVKLEHEDLVNVCLNGLYVTFAVDLRDKFLLMKCS